MPGTPRGVVHAGPRGWEGAGHKGWLVLLGTCCVTGLQNETRELWLEAHAWALRSLSTGLHSAEAPAPARALVAFGGRPYGPAHPTSFRVAALCTACRLLPRHAPMAPSGGDARTHRGGGGRLRWGPANCGVFRLLF